MAGKRHHIIPRFLQKGFASRAEDETVWTWQYRKNANAPVEISTRDAVVSEHFYGKGELNADDAITDLEKNKLSPLVDALRNNEIHLDEHSTAIAELITHLSIRSKLIRKGFENMSRDFLAKLKNVISDEETVDELLSATPQSFLEEQFDAVMDDPQLKGVMEFFKALGLDTNDVKAYAVGLTQDHLNDPETRKETVTQFTNVVGKTLTASGSSISKLIKDGHIKSLIDNVVPKARVEAYERLRWRVQIYKERLILGDSPCLFEAHERHELVPSCEIIKTRTVYLPISSHQLLVGTLEPNDHVVSPDKINKSVAKCSYEQFIASESSEEFSGLIQSIGSNAALASEAELDAEIDEIRKNLAEMIYKNDSGESE